MRLRGIKEPAVEAGMSKKAVARRLGCSVDHVANLIAAGILPAVRVPGRGKRAALWIVMPSVLERKIREWSTDSDSEAAAATTQMRDADAATSANRR